MLIRHSLIRHCGHFVYYTTRSRTTPLPSACEGGSGATVAMGFPLKKSENAPQKNGPPTPPGGGCGAEGGDLVRPLAATDTRTRLPRAGGSPSRPNRNAARDDGVAISDGKVPLGTAPPCSRTTPSLMDPGYRVAAPRRRLRGTARECPPRQIHRLAPDPPAIVW